MKKVSVLIPLSWEYVPTRFMVSVWGMMDYGIGKYSMDISISNICYLDVNRNDLVDKALKSETDYILFLDADQTYPVDTISMLMEGVDSGKSVVGGLTPKRSDMTPLVYKFVDAENGKKGFVQYDREEILSVKDRYAKCGAMGMGGIMMKPSVFDRLSKPYFKTSLDETRQVGEDIFFYTMCNKAGIDIWCDTKLKFGHTVNISVEIDSDKKTKEN